MTVGVNAVVLKGRKILLIRREDLKFWALPGGQLEKKETLAQAIAREVKEETNIDIKVGELSGIYIRTIPFLEDLLFVFKCSPKNTQLISGKETVDLGWFPKSEVEKLAPRFVQQLINDCLKNPKQLPIRKINIYEPGLIFKFIFYHLRKKLLIFSRVR